MTVIENPYALSKPLDPMFTVGRHIRVVQAKVEITAETAAKDVVILAKGLPATARIHRIMLPKGSSAIAGLTDVDIGFYASRTNKLLDADAVVDGKSFAAALGNVDIVGDGVSDFDATKDIATLLGMNAGDVPAYGFDLCATINTKGEATGSVEFDIYVEQD